MPDFKPPLDDDVADQVQLPVERDHLRNHPIWSRPPVIILFTLIVSDPELRNRFEADVPGVLAEFGLSCPRFLVGLGNRFCPVMPPIPRDSSTADDIHAGYWRKWLDGAVPQLDDFGSRSEKIPLRSELPSATWDWIIARAKEVIAEKTRVMLATERKPKKRLKTRKVPDARTFQLVNVSLPKTGSSSLSGIFGNYREAHEMLHGVSARRILNWKAGLISDSDLCFFIENRNRVQLDFDNATFLHWAVELLPSILPGARFLICVRDFPGWVCSFIAMMYREFTTLSLAGQSMARDYLWIRYARAVSPRFDLTHLEDFSNLHEYIRDELPRFVEFWGNSVLDTLRWIPPERRLVIRTHQIGESQDLLARFLGIRPESLDYTGVIQNTSKLSTSLRARFESGELEAAASEYATRIEAAIHGRCRMHLSRT